MLANITFCKEFVNKKQGYETDFQLFINFYPVKHG